ncbi:MAG: PDZ domain-containing protein [Acidobacteriota bacterium]
MMRRSRAWPGLLAASTLLCFALPAAAAQESLRISRAFERLKESVVAVHYALRLLETPEGGQGDKIEGVLCGIVASPDLVVTTADIFPDMDGDPRQIYVPVEFHVQTTDGNKHLARAVGLDRPLNLAFLRIKRPDLFSGKAARFADREPIPGEKILLLGLLGEQLGYVPTYTEARVVRAVETPRRLFVFDTLVEDLTIGGLAATPRGKVLGMIGEDLLTTPPSGPSDLAAAGNVLTLFSSLSQGQRPGYPMLFPYKGLLDDLIAHPPGIDKDAASNRGWLGIIMQPLSQELADYWQIPGPGGVVIGAVLDGSPAQGAGLQVGDVILEVDHHPVMVREQRNLGRFRELVQQAGVGRKLPLSIYRHGTYRDVDLTLGARPKTIFLAEEAKDDDFGLTVKELTFDFLQAINMPSKTQGVFISDIKSAGWADVGGLSINDVITQIHGQSIRNLDDFNTAMQKVHEERPAEVVFFVRRGTRTIFVPIKTDW